MVKRLSMFAVVGILSLVVLAACGSEDEEVEPTVTRVPATNAPVVTATAAAEASEEASASPVAGSPVASPSASGGELPVASPMTGGASSPVASPAASPEVATPAATTGSTQVTIAMKDIFFEPKEITIPANTDVVVTLPNNGFAPHSFGIDALGIKTDEVPSGQSITVTINAAPGTYDYYCGVPGHKEAGMVGKLIVQ